MNIEEFINSLDFEEYDYFYHITEKGNAEDIFEEGLFVNGNNILNTNNILETTTLPLTEDMVLTATQFSEYLDGELNSLGIRDTSEFVVLGVPKSKKKNIVSKYEDYIGGEYFEGVISNEYIMGYFSKDTLEFTPNENYEYATDDFYDTISYR